MDHHKHEREQPKIANPRIVFKFAAQTMEGGKINKNAIVFKFVVQTMEGGKNAIVFKFAEI